MYVCFMHKLIICSALLPCSFSTLLPTFVLSDMLPYFSHLRPYICSVLLRVPFLTCSRTCFSSDLHPYLVMLPVPFFCHAAVPALLALPMHGGSRWQLEETVEKSSGNWEATGKRLSVTALRRKELWLLGSYMPIKIF